MKREYFEMNNNILLQLATEGDHGARVERLVRDIMAVDQVTWDQAQEKLMEITRVNRQGMYLATMPYRVGIASALFGGAVSIPLVFNLDTALWFNEYFVTTDVPPPEDLETPLEVGSWTWNWMEPPLGQISFLLLTLQFARNQMQNLGQKPYTAWLKAKRAKRLQEKYPQYHHKIISDFALSDSFSDE